MSMYLPNDDVGPTGGEGAEFIDVPVPDVDPEPEADANATPEADEPYGVQQDEPDLGTDADGAS